MLSGELGPGADLPGAEFGHLSFRTQIRDDPVTGKDEAEESEQQQADCGDREPDTVIGQAGHCIADGLHLIAALREEARAHQRPADDEGAHVGCQSGLRPRDTPLGLILFLVPTLLPIP